MEREQVYIKGRNGFWQNVKEWKNVLVTHGSVNMLATVLGVGGKYAKEEAHLPGT